MVDTLSNRLRLGKRVGGRIATRRKALNWTQEQLAEKLEVDTETVSRFERGVTIPSLLTLEKLAATLSVSMGDLLSDVSISPSDQAIRMTAWLSTLTPENSQFVEQQMNALCNYLNRQQK